VSHLDPSEDGSIMLVADRRVYPRALVKRSAAIVTERCHVLLDLNERGDVVVRLSAALGHDDALRDAAGHFGNLLLAEVVRDGLDEQTQAARNLLVARALDGALPSPAAPQGAALAEEPDER
jgi:His-Xaa-Ser system protein HxsD